MSVATSDGIRFASVGFCARMTELTLTGVVETRKTVDITNWQRKRSHIVIKNILADQKFTNSL